MDLTCLNTVVVLSWITLWLSLVKSGIGLMCVVCDSERQGESNCVINPPPAINCSQSCFTHANITNCFDLQFCSVHYTRDLNGTLIKVLRTCFPYGLRGEVCHTGVQDDSGQEVKVCINTCDLDGCNTASFPVPTRHFLIVISLLWNYFFLA